MPWRLRSFTDDLAAKLRSLLHPTGDGGTISRKKITCSPRKCTAVIDIAWEGGLTGSKYTSSVTWTVTTGLASTASLENETSAVSADGDHIAAMRKHLAEVARGFGHHVGAPAASATAPEAAPPAAPATNLDRLAALATPDGKFKIADGDDWALLPLNTVACERDVDGKPVRMDYPKDAGSDEFELRRELSHRDDVRKKYVGKLVKFAADDVDVDVSLSKYDFARKRFGLVIAAGGMSPWPMGGSTPTFSQEGAGAYETYENNSRMRFTVNEPEDQAEWFEKHAVIDVTIVQEFLGLGLHRVCGSSASNFQFWA